LSDPTASDPTAPTPIASAPTAVAAPVRSYRVIIPPTWAMIPVGDRSDAVIDALLDERFAGLPLDSYGPRKARLGDALRDGVRSARAVGGVDLIIPTSTPWQVPLSVGIVISQVPSTAPSALATNALVARTQKARPGSTIVETRAGNALREVVDHAPLSATAPDAAVAASGDASLSELRTIYYSWPVPGENGGTLVAACTIAGGRNSEYAPITEGLTELFDVMMETLVWATLKEAA
jgi:hypothetical protein